MINTHSRTMYGLYDFLDQPASQMNSEQGEGAFA